MKKLLAVLGGAGALLVWTAGPAAGHVEPSVEEAPAGSELVFSLTVGHGCEDDSDTVGLEVQLPEGIEEATPQAIPGWDATVEGNVVTWEGGPLPHDQYLQFGLSVALPDAPGETLTFPTVQTCASGAETAWIEDGEESEHPAPALTLTEATDEGHGHGDGEETDTTTADHADEGAAAAGGAEDDDGPDALAVVALIVGALGLVAAGVALVTARKGARQAG